MGLGMASLLWLEGVDFAEHIEDTNDISIVRGSSLALLYAGSTAHTWLKTQEGLAGSKLVFTGASLALFSLPCDAPKAREHARKLLEYLSTCGETVSRDKPEPPFAHLRFVAGVAVDDGSAQAVHRARAAARLAQMTGDYPRRALGPQARMCPFTRSLPADAQMRLTPSKIERLNQDAVVANPNVTEVSSSARARRYFGRKARELVFEQLMNLPQGKGLSFTNDLHEMVQLPHLDKTPPMSVENKLAYFYADGNSFTKIRNGMGGTAKALAQFSAQVKKLMEEKIIGGVLDELLRRANSQNEAERASAVWSGPDERDADETPDTTVKKRLRFELLLYGGDEICFIVPAWLGLDVARLFFQNVAGAKAEYDGKSYDLHFKAGLIFAPYKMPVASARELVKNLADEVKVDDETTLGVHAFESVEPPANGLAAYRAALFGDPDGADYGDAAEFAKEVLALPSTDAISLINDLVTMKRDGFPRSQLYRALRIAQWEPVTTDRKEGDQPEGLRTWPGGLGSTAVQAKVKTTIAKYKGPDEAVLATVRDRHLSRNDAAIKAWLLTHLWDYADPFELAAASRDVSGKAA